MTEKEKIRAEIKRLYNQSLVDENRQAELGLKSAACTSYGKSKVCKELLSFIDSMQEECNITGIKSKEATGKLKEYIDNVSEEGIEKARKQLEELTKECMYSKDNYTDEDRKVLCDGCEEECKFNKKEDSLDLGCGVIWKGVIWKDEESVSEEQVKESLISKHKDKTCKENGNSLTQEPISDDLEEAIDTYLATYFGGEKEKQEWPFLKKMAIHFAEWQKQKDAEAINENALLYNARLEGIEIGKAEMKQQMTAKAVDVEVKVDAGGFPYIPQMELYDYGKDIPLAKEGDKYKVILIKE